MYSEIEAMSKLENAARERLIKVKSDVCILGYLPHCLATFQIPIYRQNKSNIGYFCPINAFLGGLEQKWTQKVVIRVEKCSPKKPDCVLATIEDNYHTVPL